MKILSKITPYILIAALILILAGCREVEQNSKRKEYSTEVRSERNMIIMDNGIVAIGFSKTDGSITLLTDLKRNIRYVNETGADPFRIEINNKLQTVFTSFSWLRDKEITSGEAYKLSWEISEGISLKGRIELPDGADKVVFTSQLENVSKQTVMAVEYPIIGRLESIGKENYIAHPYVTGLEIRNPVKNFYGNGGGLRFMPYPESFSGASMQFFTYYSKGIGGIYAAAYDPAYCQKWLNFYKMDGKLELSLMYGYEDIGPGKDVICNFSFEIRMINGNDWYEAADIYKEWAVQQDWTKKGTLFSRGKDEKASWLLEDIGLSTFGINAGYDRTKWLKLLHETIKTPIFHILGPDWVNDVQSFDSGVPGGYEDWVPTKFSKENLDLIKKQGDRFAPFEFDFLVDPAKSDGENLKKNLTLWPDQPKSHDKYQFNMLCPYTEYTRELHIKRDVQVLKEAGIDSMYYDISANNLIKTCMSANHGHPIGAGRIITESYRKIYKDTHEALSREAGCYIPLGTEMMNEVFIDVLDYYQARAWAQPAAALETWPFRNLMKSGEARMIPMFSYVYHEYGPVRLDGWGKLVEETGELFYHTVAKTYLWGGMYELNYEYSPMEAIDGEETKSEEHYWKFRQRGYEFSRNRVRYIAQFAALRTGAGNKYLAYGVMKRPLQIQSPVTNMKWYHYNHTSDERGSIEVDSVITSTWVFEEGNDKSFAVFFANVTDKKQEIHFELDIKSFGMEGKWKMRLLSGFDADGSHNVQALPFLDKSPRIFTFSLEPKTVYMLEAYK